MATAPASLAVITAADYMSLHAHNETNPAEWAELINAAIASGKLGAMP